MEMISELCGAVERGGTLSWTAQRDSHMEKVPGEGIGGGVVVVGRGTHGNSECEVCSRNRTLWPEQNEL